MSIKWHGAKAKAAARRGAVNGLQAWADLVLDRSRAVVPVAPVRGGLLRDSGKAEVDDGALRAAVSYDGPDVGGDGRRGGGNLAVLVHENMQVTHAHGSAKYLENPLNASLTRGRWLVTHEIRKELGTVGS